MNPEAYCVSLSDDFICASVYHPDKVIDKIKSYNHKEDIAAVFTVGHDVPHTLAHVAKLLNLPGPTVFTGSLSVDKIGMKKLFKDKKIPIPWFKEINNFEEFHQTFFERKKDFVLKPNDSRGSRGVLKLNKEVDLNWAYNYSIGFSNSKQLILEEWVEGPQFSTESIIWDDKAVLCGICDRGYSSTKHLYPYIIEDSSITPSVYNKEIIDEISRLLKNAASAIGLKRGTIKGDIVLSKNGPKIIEVTTRLSGGFFSTHTIPAAYGTNLIKQAIKISLGKEPNWEKINTKPKKYVASTVLFVGNGKITNLSFDESKIDKGSIILSNLYIKENDIIRNYTNLTERSGLFITSGNTPDSAKKNGQDIIDAITYELTSKTN